MSEAPPGTPDPSDEIIRDLKRKVAELEKERDNAREYGKEARIRENKAEDARIHEQMLRHAAEAREARLSEALRTLLDCPDIADNDHKDEETHAAERVARAALSGSGSGWPVPDGWKLVPVEPDDAMIEAGQDTCEEKNSWGGRVYASDIWESMLAASPAAPQQGGELC